MVKAGFIRCKILFSQSLGRMLFILHANFHNFFNHPLGLGGCCFCRVLEIEIKFVATIILGYKDHRFCDLEEDNGLSQIDIFIHIFGLPCFLYNQADVAINIGPYLFFRHTQLS